MPLSRELASTRRSPDRDSRRRSSPETKRRYKDRRSHSPEVGRRRRQSSGDRETQRSRNRSFTEGYKEGGSHRRHSPDHGERGWRRNSDRERGISNGRAERRSRSRSPVRVSGSSRGRYFDYSRSDASSSRQSERRKSDRDDTRHSVDSLIRQGPGMRSDRMFPPENEGPSMRDRLNRGRPWLDREKMHDDWHSVRGRGSSYRRGGGRFGARRGAYYGRRSPIIDSDDPTDVPKAGYYFEHDDRAGSEGGSGYYRRGGGGGRFRGGRGRWNRISFSPMRWEHDRFRSKSPTPSYEEGEGMADREEEAEEEENDEDFLRNKVSLRSRVTYDAPSSKWDTDHTDMEH